MIDRLPAWAQHLAVLGLGAFLYTVLTAVVTASGATGVDWPTVGKAALDGAAVAVAAQGLLYVTKLTTKYGRGKE